MKTIVIAGRTGKDAVLRRLQDGTAVLGFSVAVDDGYGQNKRTLWFDCSLFGKRGEALEPHLGKGSAVTVAGDISTREHDGKTYLSVRVNEIELQGGKTDNKPAGRTRRDPDDERTSYGSPARELDEEPIPF